MVDRSQFAPSAAVDTPYPFGYEQTIPTEAFAYTILEHIPEGCTVLEIGAGSGYLASCLAEKASKVVAIEIQPGKPWPEQPINVKKILADGTTYDTGKQFDRIVVSFAATEIAPAWAKQLNAGGQLIVPFKSQGTCAMRVYEKQGEALMLQDILFYAPFTAEVHGC